MEKILILENGNKSGLKSIIDFYLKEDYYKYELHVTTEDNIETYIDDIKDFKYVFICNYTDDNKNIIYNECINRLLDRYADRILLLTLTRYYVTAPIFITIFTRDKNNGPALIRQKYYRIIKDNKGALLCQ